MQLTDKLEAKRAMAKADWECWKKLEEQFEQIHGLFSFDLDDNDQEQACWDACTRNRCNAVVSQMANEIHMAPYSLSPSPQQRGSHTKISAQKKRIVACCKSHDPTRGQGVTPQIITYLLPRTRNFIVLGRGKGGLVSTIFPQISTSKGKPPKVTLWPSLFAQKPSWNKPHQVKNVMAPTISKVQPSLWEASSGNAGSVAGATSAKKRQKIVKTEVYMVLDNWCTAIRSQAGQAAAQTRKGGARDRATGSLVPGAVLSQYDMSDNDTDNEGANDDGTNNEAAANKGLGDGPTKEEAVE